MKKDDFETGMQRVEDILKSARENLRRMETEVEGLVANLEKDISASKAGKDDHPKDHAAR